MATTPAELRSLLISLSDSAEADLATVWAQLTLGTFYDALMDILPSLVGDYGDAAAALTAEWYDEHREDLNIPGDFSADIPVDPKLGAEALAGWAAALAQKNTDTALVRTSGGLVKRIFTASRDTLTIAAEQDPQARGWQRAGRGECTFCRVLISRGAVYTKSSVNFGAHDDCKCVAIPAFMGRAVPVKPYVPSSRTINDADKERVKVWIADNFGYSIDPAAAKKAAPEAEAAADTKAALQKPAAVTKAEKAAAAAANPTNSTKAVAAAKTKTPGPGKQKKAKPAGPVMTPDGRPITEIDIAKEPLIVANPKTKVGTETNPRIFRAEGNFHRTYDEGIAYFSPRWKNTPGEYDPLIAANIKRYTRGGHHDMNGYLRAHDGVVPQQTILGTTEDSIRMLDKAMLEEPKIADWTVLTRGTGPAGFNLADDEDLFSTIGKSFTEQGYWSTSVGDNPAFEGEVRMIIKTPPGTKGLYLAGKPGQTSDFVGQYGSDEGEFLLGRGSDYVVESVTKRSADASGDWQYDMVVRITGQTLINSAVS